MGSDHDCVFCLIVSGHISSEILYRDDHCIVIKDIAPKAPVHLLVIPTQHFTELTSLQSELYQVVGSMICRAGRMARDAQVEESGYRLVINQGMDSGQEIDHLHVHLLAGRPLRAMG